MFVSHRIPNIDRFLAYSQLHELESKADVFNYEDQSESLFYVVSGSIVLKKRDRLDQVKKEFIVGYVSAGEFFGEQDMFSENRMCRDNYAVTRVNTVVAEMRYDRFIELSRIYPNIMNELNSQVMRRLRRMTQRVFELATYDAKAKVNNCLKELCNMPESVQIDEGVQVKISCSDLAKMVGCTRECVGRVVQELTSLGSIDRQGHKFVVFGAVKEAW